MLRGGVMCAVIMAAEGKRRTLPGESGFGHLGDLGPGPVGRARASHGSGRLCDGPRLS